MAAKKKTAKKSASKKFAAKKAPAKKKAAKKKSIAFKPSAFESFGGGYFEQDQRGIFATSPPILPLELGRRVERTLLDGVKTMANLAPKEMAQADGILRDAVEQIKKLVPQAPQPKTKERER
jgi:hypothetical protein